LPQERVPTVAPEELRRRHLAALLQWVTYRNASSFVIDSVSSFATDNGGKWVFVVFAVSASAHRRFAKWR
jgi:hypothetical protein